MTAPRDTFALAGHAAAEATLAEALAHGRMHHAWLITGPKGVGKASLAFRAARAALGARVTGPRPLDVSPDDPIAKRIAAGAHGDFFLLERGLNERGKPRRDIPVEQARALPGFFTLQAGEGGRRVAIIDAIDDLNRHGANALLKIVEEPPPGALLLLVCHTPGAALATIRSRCRTLRLRPLSVAEMAPFAGADDAVLRLAAGRPGLALALTAQGGLARALTDALERLPTHGARALLPIAFTRVDDPGARLALVLDALEGWLRESALTALNDAPARAARLADVYADIEALRGEADGLDLDPAHALARAALLVERAAAAP